MAELLQPTPEEIKNGWSAESLTAYHAESAKRANGVIYFEKGYREQPMPTVQNTRYNRFRWRG